MFCQQVRFYVPDEEEEYGGILVDGKQVICGCCGGVLSIKEDEIEIREIYENWVNISDEIKG